MLKLLTHTLVLSGLLGSSVMASPLIGRFAGDDARLEIRADGYNLEMACAHASMAGKPRLDAHGKFATSGTFEMASGGPQRVDETGTANLARFTGKLTGNLLTLTISPPSGEPVILHLQRNRALKLVRCL